MVYTFYFEIHRAPSELLLPIVRMGVLINPIFEKFHSDVALVAGNTKTNSKIFQLLQKFTWTWFRLFEVIFNINSRQLQGSTY